MVQRTPRTGHTFAGLQEAYVYVYRLATSHLEALHLLRS